MLPSLFLSSTAATRPKFFHDQFIQSLFKDKGLGRILGLVRALYYSSDGNDYNCNSPPKM
eukprot:4160558-Amphidinium_carterae.1